MTYPDDYCCIETDKGRANVTCENLGIPWPPPEQLNINSTIYQRVSLSSITDEQRGKMSHVCRGALYQPAASHFKQREGVEG